MGTEINRAPKTNLTGMNLFLCRVAGSDLEILAQFPNEISRHARIGAIIISTAIMSSISMFFAIQTLVESIAASIGVALIWGGVIFALDSFIVASYRKDEDKLKEMKIATPRILLAIVIGISIAVPLKLKLFESEILVEIENIESKQEGSQLDSENMKYLKQVKELQSEKGELEGDVNRLQSELNDLREETASIGEELTTEIAGKGLSEKKGYGLTAESIQIRLDTARSMLRGRELILNPRIERNQSRIIQLDSVIASIDVSVIEEIELSGFGARIKALGNLMDSSRSIFRAYWVILLLIIGIETAPIFVKLFSKKGSYDDVLAMNEYATWLEQQKRKSLLHEQFNSEIKTQQKLNDKKAEAYRKVNEKLLKDLGKAQEAIGEKAIKLWKYEQFIKIDEDLDSFVSSNK